MLCLVIAVSVVLMGASGAPPCVMTGAYHEVVDELVTMVQKNASLGDMVQAALAELSQGTYLHPGETRDEFYAFLNDWIAWLPHVRNAGSYSDDFDMWLNSTAGQKLSQDPSFQNWIQHFVVARGEFMDSVCSRAVVPSWEAHVNMSQFVVPEGGYSSFNDFFTRALRPGVRPIASPHDDCVVISPADSNSQLLPLDPVTQYRLKNLRLNITTMLGSSKLAARFRNGTMVTGDLFTTYYHHMHAPVRGRVSHVKLIGGVYYGAMGAAYYEQRRRVVVIIDTPVMGKVALIGVGYATIASIELQVKVGDWVEKGDRLGLFRYGGSTVAILFNVPLRFELPPVTNVTSMGQPIARCA
eukprot:Sspe_Gene.52365::Locus_29026_Transcript_1_1_Confidence_1.000_Length_1347::g.52365::m.52365/K01613/psd, PISD; phosphatidylserine decarboxylase